MATPPDRGDSRYGAVRQYSLAQILAVWAAAAIPMAVLAWVIAPLLGSLLGGGDVAFIKALVLCILAGLIWQFVLTLILTRREQGTLRWSRVRDALWLLSPRDPRSGRVGGQEFFRGAWGWFAVVVVLQIFNSFLGEELLFRGLLLPRMRGVFGRVDFVANGVLFAFYHLHTPWSIPASLADFIYFSYPTRRWQSTWMAIIVHSGQSVFVIFLILTLVLG
jgi:membrane protease YdiL (CAAX protease family)